MKTIILISDIFVMDIRIKWLIIPVVLFSVLLRHIYNKIELISFCDYDSKPFIFGEDLCRYIFEGKITVEENILDRLLNSFYHKSLLHGKIYNTTVLLKTPASSWDITMSSRNFHKRFDSILKDDVNDSALFIKQQIVNSVRIPKGTTQIPKLRLCPHNAETEKFFSKIPDYKSFDAYKLLYLWTGLQSNPEPLMLKILDSNHWPVPQYYGSCGRLIAVQDCGLTLTHYYDSPWKERIRISYQVLKSALTFTFQDPDFAFYFTDVSPDNIAVTKDGIVKFIDLEHIIVVDKHPDDPMIDWFLNHTSKHYECVDCFTFEADEVCSHQISDHNIYAVCKEILSDSYLLPGGFLHSNSNEFSALNDLITECIEAKESDRFTIAHRILNLLINYL